MAPQETGDRDEFRRGVTFTTVLRIAMSYNRTTDVSRSDFVRFDIDDFFLV